jgi:hypothetical protein
VQLLSLGISSSLVSIIWCTFCCLFSGQLRVCCIVHRLPLGSPVFFR